VAEIEAAHPVFLINEIPESYGAAKAEYIEAIARKGLFTLCTW